MGSISFGVPGTQLAEFYTPLRKIDHEIVFLLYRAESILKELYF